MAELGVKRRKDIYDLLGQFRPPLVAMILVNTFGVLGFMVVDDYPFLDAVYQTVFTIATVGFGETHPISNPGKIFVTLLIIGGVMTWTYALGVTVSVVVNDNFMGRVREALLEYQMANYENHFIISGFTDIARQVARQFRRQEVPFVILEDNADRLTKAGEEWAPYILPLDPFLNASYRRANVQKARGVITTFAEDADNITVVATGKILEDEIRRPLLVISLASKQENKAKLMKVGADTVILPHELIGQRISALAMHPPDQEHASFLDRVAFGEFLNLDIREVKVTRGSTLDNVAIRQSTLRAVTGAHIVGIRRRLGRRLVLMPQPDTIIHAGDQVLVMGTLAQLEGLPAFLRGEREGEEPPALQPAPAGEEVSPNG